MRMMHKIKETQDSPLRSFVSLLSTAKTSLGVEIPKNSDHLKDFFKHDDGRPFSGETPCCCSLPSLKLLQSSKTRRLSIPDNKRVLRESCAEKLSSPIEFTHEGLTEAPTVLIENLVSSFSYLVKSRITNSMRALVCQSNGGDIHKKIMIKVLTAPNIKPIDLTTVVTSFRPFDEVAPFMKHAQRAEDSTSNERMRLCFEVTMDVCVFGEVPLTVILRTSGVAEDTSSTIAPNDTSGKLSFVRIVLDNNVLLEQMMVQARLAAKKALQIAADTAQSFIVSSGLSSGNVSLVSMSSQGSDLSQLSQFDEEITTQSNDQGMMPPPPPRLPRQTR